MYNFNIIVCNMFSVELMLTNFANKFDVPELNHI